MLENMKNQKYGLSTLWTQRIDHVLHFNKKATYEILNTLGKDCAYRTYIPCLIERVKESMENARGIHFLSCVFSDHTYTL